MEYDMKKHVIWLICMYVKTFETNNVKYDYMKILCISQLCVYIASNYIQTTNMSQYSSVMLY